MSNSNPTPFFSVVIPTYNRANSIGRAVQSVIDQSFQDWELIVVDDGSTDNTRNVIGKISDADARVIYIYQENAERSNARNNGIRNSKGKYICFLDSDDYYLENHLHSFYHAISINDFPVAFFFGNTFCEIDGRRFKIDPPPPVGQNKIDFFLLNVIGVPRSCIHQSILREFKFNPDVKIGEDTELWVRIARKFPVIYNPAYTQVFIEHENRTVSKFSLEISFEQLHNTKRILNFPEVKKYGSSLAKKTVLHNAYFGIAQSALLNKNRFLLIRAVFMSLLFSRTRLKEKAMMLLKPDKIRQAYIHQY